MYYRRIPHGAYKTAAELLEGEMVTNGGLKEMSLTDEGEKRSSSAGEDFEDAFKIRDTAVIANEVG